MMPVRRRATRRHGFPRLFWLFARLGRSREGGPVPTGREHTRSMYVLQTAAPSPFDQRTRVHGGVRDALSYTRTSVDRAFSILARIVWVTKRSALFAPTRELLDQRTNEFSRGRYGCSSQLLYFVKGSVVYEY